MGSPDVGSEVMVWLEDDDRKKAEEAIRSVRKRLTKAYDTREEKGVLETQRPRHIARLLAGHMGAWVDLLELMWAREHFVELGQKIAPFYDDFVKVRKAAERGKSVTSLRRRSCALRSARTGWSYAMRGQRCRSWCRRSPYGRTPRCPRTSRPREEACWIEAEAFLAVLHPNKVEEGDFIDFVMRKVSGLNKKTVDRPGLVNDVLEYVFVNPAGLRKRLLVYKPRGDVDAVLRYWTRAFKNAARDAVEPRTLSATDGPPVMRSASTLRRWKAEDNERVQAGDPPRQSSLLDRAIENDARIKHHDPTGMRLTLTQIANRLGRTESVVRNAVKRARAAGALVPQRMPNGRDYAFRRDVDEKIIERFLGAQRRVWTLGAAAREAGVPIERAVDVIQRLVARMSLDREPVVSPEMRVDQDKYDGLVELLRNHRQVATTGGSAKPRTS